MFGFTWEMKTVVAVHDYCLSFDSNTAFREVRSRRTHVVRKAMNAPTRARESLCTCVRVCTHSVLLCVSELALAISTQANATELALQSHSLTVHSNK